MLDSGINAGSVVINKQRIFPKELYLLRRKYCWRKNFSKVVNKAATREVRKIKTPTS